MIFQGGSGQVLLKNPIFCDFAGGGGGGGGGEGNLDPLSPSGSAHVLAYAISSISIRPGLLLFK